MTPRKTEDFHRVKTIEGLEVQVLDEGHLRDILILIFRWLVTGGLVALVGGGIFFFRIYSAATSAAADISVLRRLREDDLVASAQRGRDIVTLRGQLDSIRLTFGLVQPQILDLSDDIRGLRRALRQPR